MTGENREFHQALIDAVQSCSPMLYRVAQRIVGDPAVAEDMCQTAFTRAWARRSQLREPAALRGWLTRITVNESLSWLRRRRAEENRLQRMRDETPAAYEADVDAFARREALLEALAELPEHTREVVVLRTLHGHSGREVKQMLGVSDADVSRRLHRGLRAMRERLVSMGVEAPA